MSNFQTISQMLEAQAEKMNSAPALLAKNEITYSHRDIWELTYKYQNYLSHRGIDQTHTIAVLASDRLEMAVCCLAVMSSAICVPLNPEHTIEEQLNLLKKLKIKVLITDEINSTRIKTLISQAEIEHVVTINQLHTCQLSKTQIQQPTNNSISLILTTSGSTSEPKLVPLTHNNLLSSTQNICRTLTLKPNDICLNMMPLFHIGGLVDMLIAPLASGGSVICAPDMTSTAFFQLCKKYNPTWYQGTPTLLKDILNRSSQEEKLPSFRFIRTSSSPCPVELLKSVEEVFQTSVIEIYGMTETSGLITSNSLQKNRSKYGSVGKSAGPEIAIIDNNGNPSAIGVEGEILVKGPTVTLGYLNRKQASSEFSIGEWFRTGDQGYFDQEGFLFITGRIKEIINRGGEKISPFEIDRQIQQHPYVYDAAAFALPHPTLGEEVALIVKLKPGKVLSEKEISDYLSEKLASFKIPRKIFFSGTALPRNRGSKLLRYKLSEKYAAQESKKATIQPVENTEISKLIIAEWRKTLGVSEVGSNDDFFDLGGNSLNAMTFVESMIDKTGLSIQTSAIYDYPTVLEFEEHLKTRNPVKSTANSANQHPDALPLDAQSKLLGLLSGWKGDRLTPNSFIIGHNTSGRKLPIFWSMNGYLELEKFSNEFGVDQPVYALRTLFGIKSRSEENTRLLIGHYLKEILTIQPQGPYILGGFCEGAKIAVDLANSLHKLGHEVKMLFVIESFIKTSCDVKTTFFLGAKSQWSPFGEYRFAEMGIRKFYSNVSTIYQSSWSHNEYMEPEQISIWANQLREELNKPDKQTKTKQPQKLSPSAYNTSVSTKQNILVLSLKQKASVEVVVTNNSSEVIECTQNSGVFLRNKWESIGDHQKYRLRDGYTLLEQDLKPNESVILQLGITTPLIKGIWILNIDLVEEGVCWFHEKGGTNKTITCYIDEQPNKLENSIRPHRKIK